LGTKVVGLSPKSDAGKEFGRKVWGWRPIVDYFADNHEGFDKYLADSLDADTARVMGNILLDDLASGFAGKYTDGFMKHQKNFPTSKCDTCGGTGIRTDQVGFERGMATQVLSAEDAWKYGRRTGWCNGCRGSGQVSSSESYYYLSTEDLEEFALFLLNCGGAEIL
jgi:hypothetical protein